MLVCLSKKGEKKTPCIHALVAHEGLDTANETRCADHIDGDKTNNHHENLRWATHSENSMNASKTNSTTSSMYKNDTFNKPINKWVAYVCINGKLKHLECFVMEKDAARAYNTATLEHYGEFAKLNEIE